MSLTLSHPLRDLTRRFAQSRTQAVDMLSRLRGKVEMESDRVLLGEIMPARFSGADASVLDLLQKKLKKLESKIQIYDRASTLLWPINSGVPRDSALAQRFAMASIRNLESHAAVDDLAEYELLMANIFSSAIALPPCATIRSTPRRPGAPSASLPH